MDAFQPNRAESDFDNLLEGLANELAMTPLNQDDASLVPMVEAEPEAPAPVATEAPASLGRRFDPTVKIVGILTGSLTVVAVVGLIVFGRAESSASAADGVEEPSAVVAEDVSAEQADETVAEPDAAEVAEAEARELAAAQEAARVAAAAQLAEQQAAEQAVAPAPEKARKPKRKKRKRKASSKASSKASTSKPGDDFDSL